MNTLLYIRLHYMRNATSPYNNYQFGKTNSTGKLSLNLLQLSLLPHIRGISKCRENILILTEAALHNCSYKVF